MVSTTRLFLTSQRRLLATAIPLVLALGTIGCGLGDHGASSSSSGGSGGGGAPSAGTGVPGFDTPDAAVPVPGSAALPTTLVANFCATDSLAGISETGVRGFDFDSGEMIPLCSGWVIVANRTNERIEVRNVVTGAVDSVYDVPGAPQDLELDLDLKRVYATLPEQNLIASVDLLTSTIQVAATNSIPTSITQTAAEILVAADTGGELRVYDKTTLALLSIAPDLDGETIVFNSLRSELIAVSSTKVSIFTYALDNIVPTNTLTLSNDDPVNGAPLAVELAPNNDRLAIVNAAGNASVLGPNVINDLEPVLAETIQGTWKVEAGPSSGAFSPDNTMGDSDYFIASTSTDLIVFDTARHAEISRSTPASSCTAGGFVQVEFSRGGDIALARRSCGTTRGTEFHWLAPAAGFGDSTSAIGVDLVGLATVLPSLEVDPLCTVDDLSAITAASSGSLTVPRGADFEPLCDGWVFVSERATNRIRLVNVISNVTLSEWDLPGVATELILDEANKYLLATLPGASGVSRIDLAGPDRGTLTMAATPGLPTSITLGSTDNFYVTAFLEPAELYIREVDTITMNPVASPYPLEVVFSSGTYQIAYDRTTDQLFVSDEAGFARFTFNGGTNQFDLTDPDEELFDTLNSEIIAASPDSMTIALVDQTADLVYDFDTGTIADLTDTFWEVDSINDMTAIAFDSQSTVFSVATTDELILFNAEGDHAEIDTFTPTNCSRDTEARAAVSRGATIGFYKSGCGNDGATSETIFWNEF